MPVDVPLPSPVAEPPEWLPPVGVRLVPAGRWWDAVALSRADSRVLDDVPGGTGGGVLHDGVHRVWMWLVPPGATPAWEPLPRVTVLNRPCQVIEVPSLDREFGQPQWVRTPRGDGLTDPAALHAALHRVLALRARQGAALHRAGAS
jgi:hypothetical protein